jgi:hypothetical protein
LNLRPPGYEPGELPDCSTPRREAKDTIASVPWWTWIALGFFAAVVLAGLFVALLAFRALTRTRERGETLTERVDDLARRAEALQARLEHADERAAEVQRHTDRLERSLARLSVLTWALGDARRGFARIRAATTLRK